MFNPPQPVGAGKILSVQNFVVDPYTFQIFTILRVLRILRYLRYGFSKLLQISILPKNKKHEKNLLVLSLKHIRIRSVDKIFMLGPLDGLQLQITS